MFKQYGVRRGLGFPLVRNVKHDLTISPAWTTDDLQSTCATTRAMSLAMSLGSRQALAPTLRAPKRVATNRARAATRVVPRASALSERIVQDANAAFSIPGSVVFEEGKGGLPVCKLTHKNGGTAEVYIFGACVTSW